ncbi:MAG: hypothetical protein IKU86_08770 [Thermoguttaceae bacterium]|nr:hypothetical protein [Thermoguttaceae bacterium]
MRNANRFYRGEPLTAARLNDLVEAANRFGSGDATGRRPVRTLTVKNESGAVVPRFGVLEVSGFWRPAATRDEAVERFAASGIEVVGKTPTGALDAFLVVATEPIPPGEFGAATPASGALFLAEVVDANDANVGESEGSEAINGEENGDDAENDAASFGFATVATGDEAGKYVAAPSGPFRIVARSGSGVCLLSPVVETPDPFVIDYVERQPSYPTGSHISNRTWRDEYTPNGLKCYLCYCDLYDDKNATLGDLFAKKLKWDVTSRDWTGTHLTGLPCEASSGDRTVLTPVCCGIQATILTGSEYKADDIRTWSYRNGWAPKPPLTGRAFFPFPIFLQFALSWNDAENERMYFRPYNAVVDAAGWPNTETHELCVLDHPRRHFATLDDVPDVFFLPGLRGASIQLLCPVCYVPKQAEYIFDFKTTYETDDAFRFALETRPFKTAPGDRCCEKRWEAAGTPPDALYSAVAIGPKSTRFTSKLYTASTRPSTPADFAVSVDGATVSLTWSARQYAATYPLRIENLAGEIVAAWAPTTFAATWTAPESGDYVAFLAAADAADLRSEETSVAFSVVVPAE